MNTAKKIEYLNNKRRKLWAKHNTIGTMVQKVEKAYAPRTRRMFLALGIASAILVVNGLVVTTVV